MTTGERLRHIVRSCPWLMRVLATVRASGLPDAWVGAGAQRGYNAQAPATSSPLKRSNTVCAAAFVPSVVCGWRNPDTSG